MKQVITLFAVLLLTYSAIGQTDIVLNIHHQFEGTPLVLNDVYTDWSGKKVKLTRVEYYLGGIVLTHDLGTQTALTGKYVLANGNQMVYPLGNENITTMEGLDFKVGVLAADNNTDPVSLPAGDPLGPQSPSMNWGWPAGYRFLVIEGEVDSDADDVPDKVFEAHLLGDAYLTAVSLSSVAVDVTTEIQINVTCNVADWLQDIDLVALGYSHGINADAAAFMGNTVPETVFESTGTVTGIEDQLLPRNNVHVNYELPYAPTIFYQFPTATQVNINILDISGKTVISATGLNNEGKFFLNQELPVGTYIATFAGDDEVIESKKFIVRR